MRTTQDQDPATERRSTQRFDRRREPLPEAPGHRITGMAAFASVGFACMTFLLVWAFGGQDLGMYTGDASSVLDGDWNTGLLSNVGILSWWAAGVACLLVGCIRGWDPRGRVLLHAGVLCTVLTLDDQFQFHEDVGPRLLRIPEAAITLTYGAILVSLLIVHRAWLRRSAWQLLVMSGVLLGYAVAVDVVRGSLGTPHTAVEDLTKFVGIVLWGVYWISTAAAWAPRPPHQPDQVP